MKKKHKLAGMLLALVLLVSLVPIGALAGGRESTSLPQETQALTPGGEAAEQGLEPPQEPTGEQPGKAGATQQLMTGFGDALGIAASIALRLDSNPSFRTYVDPANPTPVTEVSLNLSLTVEDSYSVEDAVIAIPLDGIAKGFAVAGTQLPYFYYSGYRNAGGAFDVAGIGVDAQSNTLLIPVLDNPGNGVSTIALDFAFESSYEAHVLEGTVMWQDIYAELRDGNGTAIQTLAPVGSITTNANPYFVMDASITNGNLTIGSDTITYISLSFTYYYPFKLEVEYPIVASWTLPAGFELVSAGELTYDVNPDGSYTFHSTMYSEADATASAISTLMRNKLIQVRIPDDGTFTDGQEFTVAGSMSVVPVGYGVQDALVAACEQTYVLSSLPAWDLLLPTSHGTGGSYWAISNIHEGSLHQSNTAGGQGVLYAFGAGTIFNSSLSNAGSQPVKVHGELYQPGLTDGGSARLDIDSIELVTRRANNAVAWTEYQIYYEIASPDGYTRVSDPVVYAPTNNAVGQSFAVGLPLLASNEYIWKVHVRPMGADGTQEDTLGGENGFSLRYTYKAWENLTWPDGTAMEEYAEIEMNWLATYEDEAGVEQVHHGDSFTCRYVLDGVYAYARLYNVDSNPTAVQSGGTVKYELRGFNWNNRSYNEWKSPVVVIRVPAVLTIEEYTTTLTDEATGTQYGVAVMPLSLGADGYNYYKFSMMEAYNAPRSAVNGSAPAFVIPITFQVNATAAPGRYSFANNDVLVASGEPGFLMTDGNTYTVPDGYDIAQFGYAEGDRFSFTSGWNNEIFTISNIAQLSARVQIKSPEAGVTDWISAVPVPISLDGGTAQMKLTLQNTGNVAVSNVNLYDIFPYQGYLTSNADAKIVEVEVSGVEASVYFTSTATGSLPVLKKTGSENDITNINVNTSAWYNTGLQDDSTAVYVACTNGLQPGESLEIILTIEVPPTEEAGGGYEIHNMFSYTGRVNYQLTTYLSDEFILTTKAYSVLYDANLPEATAVAAESLPEAESYLVPLTQAVVVNAQQPTLAGYTFTGWNTQPDGGGTPYAAGETMYGVGQLTASGSETLYAQWQLDSSQLFEVLFFSDNQFVGKLELPARSLIDTADVPVVDKEACTLAGWAQGSLAGPLWSFAGNKTPNATLLLYAVWETMPVPPPTYTVTYAGNGHTGGSVPVDSDSPYEAGETVTVLGAGDLEKQGYSFAGWKSSADGLVYDEGDSFTIAGDTVLTAQWREKTDSTTTSSSSSKPEASSNSTTSDSSRPEVSSAPTTSDSSKPEVSSAPTPSDSSRPEVSSAPTTSDSSKPEVSSAPTTSDSSKPEVSSAPTTSDSSKPEVSSAPTTSDSSKPEVSSAPTTSDSSKPEVSSAPTTSDSSKPEVSSAPATSDSSKPEVSSASPASDSSKQEVSSAPTTSDSSKPEVSTAPITSASSSKPQSSSRSTTTNRQEETTTTADVEGPASPPASSTARGSSSGFAVGSFTSSSTRSSSGSSSSGAAVGSSSVAGGPQQSSSHIPGSGVGEDTPSPPEAGEAGLPATAYSYPAPIDTRPNSPDYIQDNGTVGLFGTEVPLGGLASRGGWGLVNLIMGILSLVCGVAMLLRMLLRRNKQQQEYEDESMADLEYPSEEYNSRNSRRARALGWLAALLGILPLLLFLILENLTRMLLVTRWTPLIGAVCILHLILLVVSLLPGRDNPEEEAYLE